MISNFYQKTNIFIPITKTISSDDVCDLEKQIIEFIDQIKGHAKWFTVTREIVSACVGQRQDIYVARIDYEFTDEEKLHQWALS